MVRLDWCVHTVPLTFPVHPVGDPKQRSLPTFDKEENIFPGRVEVQILSNIVISSCGDNQKDSCGEWVLKYQGRLAENIHTFLITLLAREMAVKWSTSSHNQFCICKIP